MLIWMMGSLLGLPTAVVCGIWLSWRRAYYGRRGIVQAAVCGAVSVWLYGCVLMGILGALGIPGESTIQYIYILLFILMVAGGSSALLHALLASLVLPTRPQTARPMPQR